MYALRSTMAQIKNLELIFDTISAENFDLKRRLVEKDEVIKNLTTKNGELNLVVDKIVKKHSTLQQTSVIDLSEDESEIHKRKKPRHNTLVPCVAHEDFAACDADIGECASCMKMCTYCKNTQLLDCFYKKNTGAGGRSACCKTCRHKVYIAGKKDRA